MQTTRTDSLLSEILFYLVIVYEEIVASNDRDQPLLTV